MEKINYPDAHPLQNIIPVQNISVGKEKDPRGEWVRFQHAMLKRNEIERVYSEEVFTISGAINSVLPAFLTGTGNEKRYNIFAVHYEYGTYGGMKVATKIYSDVREVDKEAIMQKIEDMIM